jgi:hypothetical protein
MKETPTIFEAVSMMEAYNATAASGGGGAGGRRGGGGGGDSGVCRRRLVCIDNVTHLSLTQVLTLVVLNLDIYAKRLPGLDLRTRTEGPASHTKSRAEFISSDLSRMALLSSIGYFAWIALLPFTWSIPEKPWLECLLGTQMPTCNITRHCQTLGRT